MFEIKGTRLEYRYDAEILRIEPWGTNAVRVRATKSASLTDENYALLPLCGLTRPVTEECEDGFRFSTGKITVTVSREGRLTVRNAKGKTICKEYWRNRRNVTAADCSALEVEGREFKPNIGGHYHLTFRMESLDPNERIYGMGQYQQSNLNLKGCDLELAQRNSQASVPFFLSSLGYGFLWNNPAIGRAVFGTNRMSFEAYSTDALDFWITVGDSPAEMIENYAAVTGTVPMMPEYGLGFWQCKLRYQTQEEVLSVARRHKELGLPMDVIVVDFFHWPYQGDWRFDADYWPDPKGMVEELAQMGIQLMVSVWPTVDWRSENYAEMVERGLLVRTERGVRTGFIFEGNTEQFDATNPAAREYIWEKIKQNYYDLGIRIFWLDEAEPEYTVYDFDNFRYHLGTNLEIGNLYPVEYARAFYEGMKREGQENIVNLLRCAWAGSQKYGALVWSGDIASSFLSMRNQLIAGLNMGMAGLPWWTTDIGGFHGGDPNDPEFRELFARWFAWATYCPVMRLHGDREPRQPQYGTTGGATCRSGAANEVWSYGEEVFEVCKKFLTIRENLRDYTRRLMQEAHEKGAPIMRTLFYEFPQDRKCWTIEDEYMYGDSILVAPILEAKVRERSVYLPDGCHWKNRETGEVFDGGTTVRAQAPLSVIPTYQKLP